MAGELEEQFCLFSLSPSSTSLVPEPGMLERRGAVGGHQASIWVGRR